MVIKTLYYNLKFNNFVINNNNNIITNITVKINRENSWNYYLQKYIDILNALKGRLSKIDYVPW